MIQNGTLPLWRQRLGEAWRGELARNVVAPFLVQRSLLFALVAMAALLVPTPGGWHALPTVPLLDPWLRWDSAYYLIIAARGYGPSPWGDPAAYFPLYPATISLLGVAMPRAIAALVIANGCSLAALALLYELGKEIADQAVARRAVWLALIFPTSYFLSAGYAESIYLLAALGTLLAWRRGRFGLATVGALAATLASPSGALCMSVPFVAGWLQRREGWSKAPWFVAGALAGTGLLLLIHYYSVGDALAFLHPQVSRPLVAHAPEAPSLLMADGQRIELSWVDAMVHEGIGSHLMGRLLNWGAILLVVAASLHLFRRRAFELALIVLLTLVGPMILQGSVVSASSMARYTLGAVPIFFVLASWAPGGVRARTLDSGFVMLQAVLAALFAAWYWAQ